MILGKSVPNSHLIAANAKPESRRELPFITGQLRVRCSAQVAVMDRFGSFSHRWPMKMSIQAVEIRMLANLKEGGDPFFMLRKLTI